MGVGVFKRRRLILLGMMMVGTALLLFYMTQAYVQSQKYTEMTHFDKVKRINGYAGNIYNGIPKIIHQTWNLTIPEVFHDNIKGLVTHNKPPAWTYFFWTLESAELLISKHYPALLRRYKSAKNLLKADILRLVVLHRYGGVYFDLDTVSVKPLDPYVETHDCSLTTDPPEHAFHPTRAEQNLMITNSAMLCKPDNWFILLLIRRLEQQSSSCRGAIPCTGPEFISNLYKEMQAANKSIASQLPMIEDYQFFEDKMTPEKDYIKYMDENCSEESISKLKYGWAKEICTNYVKRGKSHRNISEKAFTYHTWFHTYWYPWKVRSGLTHISKLVPHVTYYDG